MEEITHKYRDMPDELAKIAVATFRLILKQPGDLMKKTFELSNPTITIASDQSYVRIEDDESAKVFALILRNYGKTTNN